MQMRRLALEARGGGNRLDLLFEEAQHMRTSIGGLWVVAGKRGVTCIFRGDLAASSCSVSANAVKYGMVLELGKRDRARGRFHDFRAQGLAPDGTKSVRVRVGSRLVTIPVINNSFAYRANRLIRIVGLIQ